MSDSLAELARKLHEKLRRQIGPTRARVNDLDELARIVEALAFEGEEMDRKVRELEALAAEAGEKTKHWPHGFIHPKPGSDLGWELIVGGSEKAQEIRDACERCR